MILVIVFSLACLGALLALQWFQNSKPTLTGPAMVLSKRTEYSKFPSRGNSWNHLVCFRFPDGDEIELYVSQEEFAALTEGQSGQLSWHQKNMVDFIAQ